MLELLSELRTCILDQGYPVADWSGEPAVLTRRPVHDNCDVEYPLIIITPTDALSRSELCPRSTVFFRIFVYGRLGQIGCDDYRVVEEIAWNIRELFETLKFSGQPISTIQGPLIAPSDDEEVIARYIQITMRA